MVDERKVPNRYKVTEVGIIPEDWGIRRIGDEIDSLNSGVSVNSHEGDVSSNNPGILKTSSVSKGKFIPSESKRIIKRDLSRVKLNPKYDSLIISRMNTPELVGECGYVDRDYPFLFIPDRLWQTNFKQNSTINCKWLSYVLSSNKYRRIIKDIATGTSNSMKNITKDEFLEIHVPYPNKFEQEAIAEALSDTDNLILSLEKLIDKKNKIKQGVMQQLLTGKKRLPGFSGEWEVKRLGEIGEFSGAGIDKKINADEEKVRLLNFLDVYHKDFIYSNDLWHEVTAPKYKAEKCSIKRGDVFFTPSSELRTDIALSAVAMEDIDDAVYSYHVVRYRFYDEWDIHFKTYIFNTRFFFSQAETMCEGSGKRYVISLKKFKELEIMYPIDLREQKAIAQILSDMDAEIEALDKKLEKYKTIKQGMMQELLTGRIRLI